MMTSAPPIKRHVLSVTTGAKLQVPPRMWLPAGSIVVSLADENGTALGGRVEQLAASLVPVWGLVLQGTLVFLHRRGLQPDRR